MKKSASIVVTLLLGLLSLVVNARAQTGNVGIGTSNPDASALLEMQSTDKGILIPRMTYAQRNAIAAPVKGLLIFQTDSIAPATPSTFYYWDGTQWVPFLFAGRAWQTFGNSGTNASTNFLGTTDSVDMVIRTNNQERLRVYAHGNVRLISKDTSAEQLQFSERPDSGSSITSFRARPMIQDVNYTLPDTQGGSYTVLTNDGSGNLYWGNIWGSVTYGVTTISQFTGNQNDVSLDATKTIFRMSSSANMNVSGFANGWNGRMIVVVNVGSNSIALQNQSTSSSAANRIITSSGNSIAMQTNEAISLIYDGVSSRWRPIAKTP